MVACPDGATRNPVKPKYVRVTEADIERWYPGAGGIFYVWMRPFVGRVFDVDALAILNPDVPVAATWQDFLADALHLWGLSGPSVLSSIAEQQVAYFVFMDNCLCNGTPGSTVVDTFTGRIYAARPPDSHAITNPLHLCAPGDTVVGYVNQTAHARAGLSSFLSMDTYDSGGVRQRTETNYDDLGGGPATWTWTILAGEASYRTYFASNAAAGIDWTEGTWTATGHLGPGSPVDAPLPPAPTWTDLPPYVAPSGTTTDQLELKLDSIISSLAGVVDLTRATQRTVAPQAPIVSGSPSTVTGEGLIAVTNAVAVLVDATVIPAWWGGIGGSDPRRIPSLATVRFGTAAGAERGEGIRHVHTLLSNPIPYATRIVYDVAAGVTLRLTPYTRES